MTLIQSKLREIFFASNKMEAVLSEISVIPINKQKELVSLWLSMNLNTLKHDKTIIFDTNDRSRLSTLIQFADYLARQLTIVKRRMPDFEMPEIAETVEEVKLFAPTNDSISINTKEILNYKVMSETCRLKFNYFKDKWLGINKLSIRDCINDMKDRLSGEPIDEKRMSLYYRLLEQELH